MVGPRQDRQGVRSPAELERKYAFGAVFRQQGQENSRLLESVSRVSQSQSQSDARFSGLVSGLRQDVDGQKQGLADVTRRLTQAEEGLSGNVAAMAELRTALASVQGKINALQESQTALTAKVSELEGRLKALEERK